MIVGFFLLQLFKINLLSKKEMLSMNTLFIFQRELKILITDYFCCHDVRVKKEIIKDIQLLISAITSLKSSYCRHVE